MVALEHEADASWYLQPLGAMLWLYRQRVVQFFRPLYDLGPIL